VNIEGVLKITIGTILRY